MTQSTETCRWLARRIIIDGVEHSLSLAELTHTADGWRVTVEKFDHETHSTSYHPGTIRITTYTDPQTKPLFEFF